MSENDSDVEYTLSQVAVLTHVPTSVVRLWVQRGKLPCRKGPDGQPWVRRSELARFCDVHGMPPVEDLATVIRELQQLLAVTHPVVRARMIAESEWPLAEDGHAEPLPPADQPRE